MSLKDVRDELERLRSQMYFFDREARNQGQMGGELIRVLEHVQAVLVGLTEEVERLDTQASAPRVWGQQTPQ